MITEVKALPERPHRGRTPKSSWSNEQIETFLKKGFKVAKVTEIPDLFESKAAARTSLQGVASNIRYAGDVIVFMRGGEIYLVRSDSYNG